jgi:conjugative relaxase-like TrwC/TraI family protein
MGLRGNSRGLRVLGIGKIRPDRTTYHLDAVADGVEDYYFAAHEAPGVWMGSATAGLGIAGAVGREQLLWLLDSRHPTTGVPLAASSRARGGREPLPGYDVTLRAPKSVSLLWGLTMDDSVRGQVQAGHDAAVAGALQYLEAVAAVARRGSHGAARIPTSGFVAAAFRHRTSRAGDPVLHTHLVIPNVVQGRDGRWSAPDGRLLYANGKSAGYVYQALLRGELTRRLGVAWTPVRNGCADLVGTPASVMRAFSRRRQEIEEHRDSVAAERGQAAGAAAAAGIATAVTPAEVATETADRVRASGTTAQLAALETRRAKDYRVDMPAAVQEWRERSASLGFTEEDQRAQLALQSLVPMAWELYQAAASRLAGEPIGAGEPMVDDHLAARKSTFHRREVVMGWCSQLSQGADSVEQITNLADHFLRTHPAILPIPAPTLSPLTRHHVPGAGGVADGEARYTTRVMQATETALVEAALRRCREGTGLASIEAVESAIRRFARENLTTLTHAQSAAVRTITASGAGVDIVVGRAGTGKTTALRVARDAWEASGIPVAGAAKAAAAARNLELATGIPSRTLDSLLIQLHSDPQRAPLPAGGVLVVDEAATTETRTLAGVLDTAARRQWKVVLVGDDQQLHEIDAGGGFRGLRHRLGAVVLDENLRQRSPWEREAIDAVRETRAVDAMLAYVGHDRVSIVPTRHEALRLMADRWWARRTEPGLELLQAHRNIDVTELNRLVRERRVAAGEVSAHSIRTSGAEISVGDRVLTRATSQRDGVINGLRGEVVAIDAPHGNPEHSPFIRDGLTIQVDGGPLLHVGSDYLRRVTGDGLPALGLAYATTVHRNQGATAERSQTLVDRGMTADAMYVALSRGRTTNELVIAAARSDDGGDIEHWAESTAPRRALEACMNAIASAAPKHLSIDPTEQGTSSEAANTDSRLDSLVAAWRRSADRMDRISRPGRGPMADLVDSPPMPTACPVPMTYDPHLLAIERLLTESRIEPIDASERYKSWRSIHLADVPLEAEGDNERIRIGGAPVSSAAAPNRSRAEVIPAHHRSTKAG